MDNSLRPVADRILLALKLRGGSTAAALAREANVTAEAMRQQLAKLAEQGLAEWTAEAAGVGRPAQLWRLTAAGEARFPDAHAELTVTLLRTIRTTLGEAALDKLIDAREAEQLAAYKTALAGAATIEERIARLAEIRSREGYMASWEPATGLTGWLLAENHCPICAAASECQNFCRLELEIFQDVLGPEVTVTRAEHILTGARRCLYHIAPA